jgi:7-cyano-7-deazaguanine synthase
MKNTVLIYSGGMDSTVLLYHHRDRVKACLNFHYGSKHNSRERVMARENCTRLGIPFHEIDMDFIGEMFRSDLLTSGGEVPEGHYADPETNRGSVPQWHHALNRLRVCRER